MASLSGNPSKPEVLVVDDDPIVRKTLALVLRASGYAVGMAEHGFDALLQMRAKLPAVVISDLNMPQMSGFEFLSVVRRRFSQIPAIAMSGAYDCGDAVPGGVIADAFYAKGHGDPQRLLDMVADLIQNSDARALAHQGESAPVWIPHNGNDSRGIPYVVLTCTECLRSFPLNVAREDLQRIQETPCIFCANTVRYIVDFSLAIASPAKNAGGNAPEGLRRANAETGMDGKARRATS